MKKILLPTDFSEVAGHALAFADKIAQRIGAEIHILKIVSAPLDAKFDKQGNILDDGELDLSSLYERLEDSKMLLEHWSGSVVSPKFLHSKIGVLHTDILAFAQKLAIDLILMGTHGAIGTKEFAIGSNTEWVVREASTPVLSLKCDRKELAIQNIVLASDFEHPHLESLEILKEIQKMFQAKLHLLRIEKQENAKKEAKLQANMEEFVRLNALENVEFHFFTDKNVEKGVTHFAEEFNMDMIAIGTHGRKGFYHLLFGSIAEDMVNHVKKPILTFKIS